MLVSANINQWGVSRRDGCRERSLGCSGASALWAATVSKLLGATGPRHLALSLFSTEDSGRAFPLAGSPRLAVRRVSWGRAAGVRTGRPYSIATAPPTRPPPFLHCLARGSPTTFLTFLAGVTRVIAIVAGDPQDPVLDGGHPVGGRLDVHRERGGGGPCRRGAADAARGSGAGAGAAAAAAGAEVAARAPAPWL